MPELPEVRSVAKYLNENLTNKKVTKINVIYAKTIEVGSLDMKKIIGKSFKGIKTYGKYLVFDFDEYFMISHLRMEGKYLIKKHEDNIEKHEHVIIEFDELSLRYHDTRKFGRMILINPSDLSKYEGIKKLAPEPFEITLDELYTKIKNKQISIKSILLDQTMISGLGNIYADEVLFASKINPLRLGKDISEQEVSKIIESSIEILSAAIKEGGTTIKSYTSSLGVPGNYQHFLKVHNRKNEKCYICQEIICKTKVGGRGTYYCSHCQN